MHKLAWYVYNRYREQANTDWGTNVAFYKMNKFLLMNLKHLRICPNCSELYGMVILEDGQMVGQKCACNHPLPSHEKWQIKMHDKAYNMDFRKLYEICHCCGLEIIPSGSRWSSFYCSDCKEEIRKFNEFVGWCLIPFGRHSLMNGITMNTASANSRKDIKEFARAIKLANQRIRLVEAHRKSIVKKQMERLGINDNSAISLVLTSKIAELPELKRDALLDLVAMIARSTAESLGQVLE